MLLAVLAGCLTIPVRDPRKWAWPAWLLLLLGFFSWAGAATWYVATTGNDGNPGSSAQPWLTLQKAADAVQPGDTVMVRAGTYVGFRSKRGGSAGLPITFRAETGAAVVVSGPGPQSWHGSVICLEGDEDAAHGWWVIDGFAVTGATSSAGIDIRGYDTRPITHVTVRNCHCHHNQKWGIFTSFADDFTAEDNECDHSAVEHGIYHSNSGDRAVIRRNVAHDNNAGGIQINADPSMGGDGISSECEVSFNVAYGNGTAGGAAINLASVRNSLICNNLLYNNRAGGIALWDDGQGVEWGCKNNRILFNTVHMPSAGRWAVNMINGSTGNVVRNNILLHDGGRGGLETDAASVAGLVSDYNVQHQVSYDDTFLSLAQWQSQYGQDPHSQDHTAAATFVNPASDHHLLAASWARNHGLCETGVTTDLDSVARPQEGTCDIGCYEYTAMGPLRGDIDENGVVDAVDVSLLAASLAANPIAHTVTLLNADLDDDGRVTTLDLVALRRNATGG